MPRTKKFNKEAAVISALNLFWKKGYEATSLSDLTHELKIGKGSFYDTFGSKRQLFDSCIEAYRSVSYVTLDDILSKKQDPLETVKYFINRHTEMMMADVDARGCLIANSTSELSDDKEIQALLKEHNDYMRSKISKVLQPKFSDKSNVLADLVLNHVTGISMMSKFIKDPTRFKNSNEAFMKVFE
ncbi:MAG: TetR/AcrR family transcriptional regulator [Bacteroidia bacterium]